MRRFGIWALVFVCAAWIATPLPADDDQAWFDIENCGICKNFGAEEGLMDAMKWETHKIENGMLSVMTIDPAYREGFDRANANMGETMAKIHAGESVHLCGFCTSFGSLMMAGANAEEIDTEVGHISLITAADSEVVEAIHAHAQRTIDEYKVWIAGDGS